MTSKSQEPLTRPDKPVVINSDVKAFEALHGPVLRDWPSYHIHEVIAWYAWHVPADGAQGREARVGCVEDGGGVGRKGQGEAQAAGPHVHGLGCHQVFWFKILTEVPSVQTI